MLDCSIGSVVGHTCSSLHLLSNASCNLLLLALTDSGLKLPLSIPVAWTSCLCNLLPDSLSDSYNGDLDLDLDLDQDLDLDLFLEFDLPLEYDLDLRQRFLFQ
ncbi:MAG: hypothetical protein EZS28_040503 [Streblomastix strix]|uniref:Uncharacterized protein n=1 Tax=Streblomastix strix TaxID=222440 RepID=A0A5J4U1V5_9EUKA|nr:MAG: hypothetical protein EZS28_040503 [Streblomastix strix]